MTSSLEQQKRALTSLINDEQRAVSYAWLARELGVTALVSKSLLSDFVASSKQKLLVHYLISGDAKSNSTTCSTPSTRIVAVVPADKLSSAKASLETVISEHVYSVQRIAADSTPLSPLSAVSAAVVAQVRALAGDPSSRGQQVRSSFHGLIEPPSDVKISASRQAGGGDKGRPVPAAAAPNSFFGKPASTPAASTSSDGIKKPSASGGGINAFFGKAAASTNASVPTPSSSSAPSATTTSTAKKGTMDFFAAKKAPAPIQAPAAAVKPATVTTMVIDDDVPSSSSVAKVAEKSKSKRAIVIDDDDEEGDAEFDHAAFELERERQAAKKPVSGSGESAQSSAQVKETHNKDDDDDDGIFGNEEDEEQTVDDASKPSSSTTTTAAAAAAKKAPSSSSPKGAAKPRKPKQPKTSKYASAQMDDEVVVAGNLPGKSPPAKKGSISKSLKKGDGGGGGVKDGRKVETRVFMNEDGYMVTEEVFVEEVDEKAAAVKADNDESASADASGGVSVSAAAGKMEEDEDDEDSLIPRKPKVATTKPATVVEDNDDDDSLIPRKPSSTLPALLGTKNKSPSRTTKQSGLTTFFKKG